VAQWMIEHGYATGHGDTIEDLLTELGWQADERITKAAAAEREKCEQRIDALYRLYEQTSQQRDQLMDQQRAQVEAIRVGGSNG